jgi:hypothetical protein
VKYEEKKKRENQKETPEELLTLDLVFKEVRTANKSCRRGGNPIDFSIDKPPKLISSLRALDEKKKAPRVRNLMPKRSVFAKCLVLHGEKCVHEKSVT